MFAPFLLETQQSIVEAIGIYSTRADLIFMARDDDFTVKVQRATVMVNSQNRVLNATGLDQTKTAVCFRKIVVVALVTFRGFVAVRTVFFGWLFTLATFFLLRLVVLSACHICGVLATTLNFVLGTA